MQRHVRLETPRHENFILTIPQDTVDPASATPGILLALNDVVSDVEDEFNRWYQQQHLEERLSIPGFRRARRYRSVNGQPDYMVVFDCESIDVLDSPAYRHCLMHPNEWTQKVMPSFRNMQRSACRETWQTGDGMGGCAIVVQCKPIQGREEEARNFIKTTLGPTLMQEGSTVRIALWEADETVTRGPNPEVELRGGQDSVAHWVLFVECYDLGKMALALHTHILAGEGALTGLLIGSWMRFQLICERWAHEPLAIAMTTDKP